MRLLDVLLPERCAVCGSPGRPLCEKCRRAVVFLRPPVCERCGAPGPWPVRRCAECSGRRLAFASARAAIVYDDRARTFVRAWKERGRRSLAYEAAGLVLEALARPDVDVVVHVPGDAERARARGSVPPRALARALADAWDLTPLNPLRRVGGLPRQTGLGLTERRRNVRGTVVAVRAVPQAVCLVDDVYTSGATADACAAALRRGGARRVEVVTLARAVR